MLPTPETAGGIGWQAITRLGEAQLLLPAMALMLAWLLLRHRAWRLAGCWLLSTGVAAGLTTASKIAFIGYGLGSAAWDFTGLSGHAMFAAALLPVMLRLSEGGLPERWHGRGLAAGWLLALLVAVSRVPVQAHSWSEVIGGFSLGAAASITTLWWAHAPRLRVGAGLLLVLAGGLSLGVAGAPASRTHDLVTRLSLTLSGRPVPYTRAQLHADAAQRARAESGAGSSADQTPSCQASGTSNISASNPACSITRTP